MYIVYREPLITSAWLRTFWVLNEISLAWLRLLTTFGMARLDRQFPYGKTPHVIALTTIIRIFRTLVLMLCQVETPTVG